MALFTIEAGGKTEDIKAAVGLVTSTVASQSSASLPPSTGLSGVGDRVLHGSITQPASIAPVQTTFPGLVELAEGGHYSILIQASRLSIMEVQIVTPQTRGVWENNPCGRE